MTTELKVTEELFQQALKASGSFEIARSNAERVSMRRGFELGMQYARHHQADDATATFKLGDRVTKTKGSSWTGIVVGTYSTSLTPEGYAVESENEPGSVQIYPAAAIAAMRKDG